MIFISSEKTEENQNNFKHYVQVFCQIKNPKVQYHCIKGLIKGVRGSYTNDLVFNLLLEPFFQNFLFINDSFVRKMKILVLCTQKSFL